MRRWQGRGLEPLESRGITGKLEELRSKAIKETVTLVFESPLREEVTITL